MGASESDYHGPMPPARLKFVVGVEDREPMIWQLAVLLESLHGRLPNGWEPFIVVCNDHAELSESLARVLASHGARWVAAPNYASRRDIDLMGGSQSYPGLNKIGALEAVAPHLSEQDLVCLLDSDLFLYGDLNVDLFPSGNALCKNWIIEKPLFFSGQGRDEGVDLQALLSSVGVDRTFRGGGVLLFLTGATVRTRGFVRSCFRFAQTLYLLGKIQEVSNQWLAEMPVYALALTARGIHYELIDLPEFSVENYTLQEIPTGSFYHYFAPHAFAGSSWGKYHFRNRNLLEAGLDRFLELAQSDHERCFFRLARAARDRLGSAPSESKWSRGPVTDLLRYSHYHLRHAVDPKAPPRTDLTLPAVVDWMYRALRPLRRFRGRIEDRRRLRDARRRSVNARQRLG